MLRLRGQLDDQCRNAPVAALDQIIHSLGNVGIRLGFSVSGEGTDDGRHSQDRARANSGQGIDF